MRLFYVMLAIIVILALLLMNKYTTLSRSLNDAVNPRVEKPLYPSLPWYMSGGGRYPGHGRVGLYPEECPPGDDRITQQLMFLPPSLEHTTPLKNILVWPGGQDWGVVGEGREEFIRQECPVNTCTIAMGRGWQVPSLAMLGEADLVLFSGHFIEPSFNKTTRQIWLLSLLGKICPHIIRA